MAVYEGVINWTFNSNIYNTVLHYDDGDTGPPDFQGLTDDIRDKFNTAGMPGLVNDLVFTSMRWREDIAGGVGTVYVPTAGTLAGSAGASETAGQLALIIRKLGAGLVRPSKGRIYVPGVATSALQSNGLFIGTTSNALETMFEDILTIDDGGGVELDMVIKASNPSAPNTVPYNPVVGLQALGNPGTQRRRRLGVGS